MWTDNRFRILFVINLAVSLGFSMSDAYFSVYVSGLGARGLFFALAVGLYALAKIFFSPLTGYLNERAGSGRLILFSLVVYMLIACALFFSTNLLIVIALRFLQGIGTAVFRPVLLASAGSMAPRLRRASALGSFDISFYSATATGPAIGGFIRDIFGFRGLFAVLFLLCLFAFVCGLFLLKHDSMAKPVKVENTGVSDMLKNPVMLGLLFFIFGRAFSVSSMCVFIPLYLEGALGLSGTETGAVLSFSTIVMILFLRPMGKLADRHSRAQMVIAGSMMASAFVILLTDADSFLSAAVICGFIGFFNAMSQPSSSSLLVEEGTKLGMTKAAGLFNSVMNLGFAVSPLLGSLVYSLYGVRTVFYLSAVTGAVFTLICALVMSAQPSEQPDIKIF